MPSQHSCSERHSKCSTGAFCRLRRRSLGFDKSLSRLEAVFLIQQKISKPDIRPFNPCRSCRPTLCCVHVRGRLLHQSRRLGRNTFRFLGRWYSVGAGIRFCRCSQALIFRLRLQERGLTHHKSCTEPGMDDRPFRRAQN